MDLTHTIIARDPAKPKIDDKVGGDASILHLIVTFNEKHIPIAVKELRLMFPNCEIEIKSKIDEPNAEKSGK